MQSLLEKLNTPAAVITVLAVILLANGFLLYQSRSSSPEPARQVSAETDSSGTSGQDTDDGAATQEPTTAPTEETQPPEETQVEETRPEETQLPEETTSEPEEEPEENAEGSEEAQADDSTLLAGLRSSVNTCRDSSDDDEQCIRDFVVEVAPDSRYVGGRIDLAPDGSGDNTEFIYFEDPRLAPCEYERAEYDENGSSYAVFLIGEGSFSDTRGDQCIPQA